MIQISQKQIDAMREAEEARFRRDAMAALRVRARQLTERSGRAYDAPTLEKILGTGLAEAEQAGAIFGPQRRRFALLQLWLDSAEPRAAGEIRAVLRSDVAPVDARLDRAELLVASKEEVPV